MAALPTVQMRRGYIGRLRACCSCAGMVQCDMQQEVAGGRQCKLCRACGVGGNAIDVCCSVSACCWWLASN